MTVKINRNNVKKRIPAPLSTLEPGTWFCTDNGSPLAVYILIGFEEASKESQAKCQVINISNDKVSFIPPHLIVDLIDVDIKWDYQYKDVE